MLWWLLLILPLTAATLCRSGQQFWNGTLEKCVDCSKCPQEGHVVLRPCQVHQDTVCGPLSALDIDWSFMREKKHHHSEEQVLTERTSLYSSEDKSQWKKPHHHNHKKSHHHHGHNKTKHHHKNKTSSVPESASQLREVVNLTVSAAATAPFSAAEELVWDWQAVALALAVFACLLFFLVACIYSVHHARQWRRLKDHFEDFEADVGELSTRLSLLLPALHGEDTGATIQQEECCSSNGQCLYLEKLLAARKRQEEVCGERGNVYIDREMTVIQPTK